MKENQALVLTDPQRQALLEYISLRPYREVNQLIQLLSNLPVVTLSQGPVSDGNEQSERTSD